jgi:hypothetical protein
VRLAYAQRPDASAEDTALLALAERLAADVMTEEEEEALGYASTLRCRRICNDYGPTLEEARAASQKKEAARLAAKREKAAKAAALPRVTVGMRVVVIDEENRYHGRRGVVQGFRPAARSIAVRLARDDLDRCFYRRALRIETPPKPSARKPAARKPSAKPSARKPAARKPAAKPAARKPSVRKSRK